MPTLYSPDVQDWLVLTRVNEWIRLVVEIPAKTAICWS